MPITKLIGIKGYYVCVSSGGNCRSTMQAHRQYLHMVQYQNHTTSSSSRLVCRQHRYHCHHLVGQDRSQPLRQAATDTDELGRHGRHDLDLPSWFKKNSAVDKSRREDQKWVKQKAGEASLSAPTLIWFRLFLRNIKLNLTMKVKGDRLRKLVLNGGRHSSTFQ